MYCMIALIHHNTPPLTLTLFQLFEPSVSLFQFYGQPSSCCHCTPSFPPLFGDTEMCHDSESSNDVDLRSY